MVKPNSKEEVIPVAIAIEVVHNRYTDTIPVTTSTEVDASTTESKTEIVDNSEGSNDDTVNDAHQLHVTQFLPPKLQEKLNNELVPNEHVLFSKVPRVKHFAATLTAALLVGVILFSALFVPFISLLVGTDDSSSIIEIIQYFCYLSWNPLSIIPIIVIVFKSFINYFFIRAYAITDLRVITMTGNAIRSFLPNDFSDIIIRDDEVVFFQECLTDPDGKRILNEFSLPLDQDETEIVVILNNLKERRSSENLTLDHTQTSSVNVDQMYQMVTPHIEEVLNCEIQGGERVLQVVKRKKSILQSPGHAFPLGFGIYLLVVAIGVSLIPSMYFMIPLTLGLLVILLAVRDFRHYPVIVYVITDRRAIRICPRYWICRTSPSVYAFPPFQPYDVFRREYSNGTGDVIFAHKWEYSSEFGFTRVEDGFFGITNAKDIEMKLKSLARRTTAT